MSPFLLYIAIPFADLPATRLKDLDFDRPVLIAFDLNVQSTGRGRGTNFVPRASNGSVTNARLASEAESAQAINFMAGTGELSRSVGTVAKL